MLEFEMAVEDPPFTYQRILFHKKWLARVVALASFFTGFFLFLYYLPILNPLEDPSDLICRPCIGNLRNYVRPQGKKAEG